MFNDGKVKIVILAAGHGKRMESPLPKVLAGVSGKHMIRHLLEEVEKVFSIKPIVVVGYEAELVKKELGDSCIYAFQKEQLGTGNAVFSAKEELGDAEHVVVLQGDQPFTSAESIKNLIQKHLDSNAKITLATTVVENFLDWRAGFNRFGRILRTNNEITGIREYKDATDEEKEIREVNAGCYVFTAKWLWENIEKLKNDNVQKEYYLTDLLKIASTEKEKAETMEISNQEALAANTKAELEILEQFAPKK